MRERDGGYVAAVESGEQRFEIDELGRDTIRFRIDGMMESARFLRDGDRLYILHRGDTIAVRDLTLAAPVSAAAAGGDGKVRAAMNGRVVAVLVKPGEQVAAGQPVMTLEAMKMEHVHTAGVAGTVSAIDVAEGEQVTTGKIVVEIEAALPPAVTAVIASERRRRSNPASASMDYAIAFASLAMTRKVPARPGYDDILRPPRPVIQPARHLMPFAGLRQHRPFHLAAVHHIAAAGMERAAGWRVDRARDVAVDHRRQRFALGSAIGTEASSACV